MAARADKVSRVDHDGVTLVEGATSDVRFAFTERAGGVSEDAYSSLNLGSHVGDDPFAVQENRRRALEAMGAAECEHNLLIPNQVHGDHIVAVASNGADDLEDVREQIAEAAMPSSVRRVTCPCCSALPTAFPWCWWPLADLPWCTPVGRARLHVFLPSVPGALRCCRLRCERRFRLYWPPYLG